MHTIDLTVVKLKYLELPQREIEVQSYSGSHHPLKLQRVDWEKPPSIYKSSFLHLHYKKNKEYEKVTLDHNSRNVLLFAPFYLNYIL
jgi:hypothetical protein